MTETELQRSIIKALEQMGVWVIRTARNKKRSRVGVGTGEDGMPDLHLVSLASSPGQPGHNTSGWMEVKLPMKKLDPDQVAWHERAIRLDVPVCTVRSVKDAVTFVTFWRRGAFCLLVDG